jgi:hypothetical protein
MKRLKGLPIQRKVSIPIAGPLDFNLGIYAVIGQLVVSWANNESFFLAMLQVLMASEDHFAAIIWHSHRTTQARLELVGRLARERIKDDVLVADIGSHISRFKGLTGARNFYCHATYNYDSEMRLTAATGVTLAQDGDVLRLTDKALQAGTLNEITGAIVDLMKLNRELWNLVERIQNNLGVQRVERPRLPPDDPQNLESHHPKDEVQAHPSPPESSQE